MKWGTNVPEAYPPSVHGRQAAEQIRQVTDGRCELQIFSNNQLGRDTEIF